MRRALIAVGVLAVAVLVVVVALPSFVELNRFRGQFEATLQKTLQRPVKIGDIRLSLLGGPGLRVSEVSIAERPEYGQEPAVAMEELRVSLKVIPLLSRKISVRKFELRKPVIRLTLNADGTTSFSDLLEPKPKAPAKPPAAPPKPDGEKEAPPVPTALAALTVSRFDITGGSVTVIDKRTSPGKTLVQRIEELDVSLRDVSLDEPIGFDVSGVVVREGREPFRMKGSLGPLGQSPDPATLPVSVAVTTKKIELAPLQPYVGNMLPITIRSGSVTSDVTLTRGPGDKLSAKGTVRFEDMDFLDTASGYRPPKPLTVALDHSVEVDLKADTIKAERFRLTVGESDLTASGSIAKAMTAPVMDVHVKSEGLRLEDLSRLDPALGRKLPPGLGLSGPLALDVDFKGTLSAFSAKGSVNATKARLAWKELVDKAAGVPAALRFDGSYDGRRTSLKEAHLELHNMRLDLAGSVAGLVEGKPSLDLKLKTNTVSLDGWERVAPALKDNPLKGSFLLDAVVAGSTADPAKGRLDGRVALEGVGPVEKLLTIYPALKASWPKDLSMAGTTSAEVKFKGTMETFDMEGLWDFRDGDFRYGTLLEKPRGEAADVKVKGGYRKGDLLIEKMEVALKDLRATGKGTIKDIDDPLIDLTVSTNQVELAKWAPRGRRVEGRASLALGVKGKLKVPKALDFTKVEFSANDVGPLEEFLVALPSLRASLPPGFKMSGDVDLSTSFSGTYPELSGRATVDFTGAALNHPEWVVKPAGSPARLSIDGRYSGSTLVLKSFEAAFGKEWIRGAAQLAGLDAKPRGSLTLASSPVRLDELSETLPALKRYGLSGYVNMDVHLQGDTARLKEAQARGRVELKGLQASLPQLAAPIQRVSGTLELKGQAVELDRLTLAYGDSILTVSGSMQNFDAPVVSFTLDSPSLVLHQLKPAPASAPRQRALVGPPPPDGGQAAAGGDAAGAGRAGVASGDGWFAWLKKVTATGQMRVQRAVYEDWALDNLQARTSLRAGVFILNHLTFGLHGGRYDGSAVLDLDPASRAFSFQSSLAGVDVNELLTVRAKLPNTVWGRMQADLDIRGRAADPAMLLPSISGRGQVTVTEGHMNMALVRDLLRNMPVLKLVGLIPGFQKLNYCTQQFTQQETTPFQSLILPVTIDKGLAHLAPSALILDSRDIDAVTGSSPGYIDLPRQEVHLRNIRAVFSPELTDMCLGADAKPLLADSYGRMTFPFAVEGSFKDGNKPKVRPDERFLVETIQRAVASRFLQNVLGGGGGQQAPQQPVPQQPGGQQPVPQIPSNMGELLKEILK